MCGVEPELVGAVADRDDEKKARRKEAKQDGNRPLGAMERNAALAIAVSQSKFGANLAAPARAFEGAALGVYAMLALGFLLQAIDALRPGQFRPRLTHWPPDREDYPLGVRYFEDVVQRDVEAHWAAWQEVTVGQLNAELAVQVYSLCLKNKARKLSLKRLYRSLRILTMLLAVILISYL